MNFEIDAKKFEPDFVIETTRLRLRRPSESDIPHIFAATRVDGFNDGMLWEPPKDISEMQEPYQRSIQAWDAGTSFSFSIDLIESGNFVGRISIRQLEDADPHAWNIGFFTIPGCQGNGYMNEAVPAILEFGFQELKANQIEACHALWNKASKRILEKNGMTFIRHIPEGFQKNSEWVAEDLLGISKEVWVGKHS